MFSNFKMSKLILILVLVCVVSFTIGGTILLRDVKNPFTGVNTSTNNIDDEQDAGSIDSVNEITVDTSSMNINIIKTNDANVKAHLTGRIQALNNPELPKLIVSKDGNSIDIRVDSRNSMVFVGYYDVKLDVYLPSKYQKSLSLKASSGNINIDGYSLENFTASASSGNINTNNIECESYNIDLTSGNITGSNLKGKGRAKTSSGNITLDKIEGSDINFIATSGSIKANIVSGNIKADSSSGNINIAYEKFDNNVELKASSGNCTLKLPGNAEFALRASASSGDVKCDFPVTVTGSQKEHSLEGTVRNSKNSIRINTSSGNIKIY